MKWRGGFRPPQGVVSAEFYPAVHPKLRIFGFSRDSPYVAFSLNEKHETVRSGMNAIVNRETIVMQRIGLREKKESRADREEIYRALCGAKINIGCHALAALLPRIIEIVGVVLPRAALRRRADKRFAFLVDGVP